MRRHYTITMIVIILAAVQADLFSSEIKAQSRIKSVKLFTNMAKITRVSEISLKKGLNTVIVDGLPDNLYDWSAKGNLPEKFKGKIMSLEISRQALLEKRRKKILTIEKKLEELRDKDIKLADDLNNLKEQENFLNSISTFTEQTASKELATRIPQTTVWSNTARYLNSNRKTIQTSKRNIQKKRKKFAKEIQKLEFDLNQIAGSRYYRSYMELDQAVQENTASLKVQQYGNFRKQYAAKENYLRADTSGIDTEKKIELSIYSASDSKTDFVFSYIIPDTSWQMKYDFRASQKDGNVEVILYSDIRQKTGEDWENINLSLSTGAPLNNISVPDLYPWYLNVRNVYRKSSVEGYSKSRKSDYKRSASESIVQKQEEREALPETSIKSSGINFEISFPLRQSIESSNKYQKKYLKTYTLRKNNKLRFFYKTVPSRSTKSYLMATAVNTTELPWLAGQAQVFLENEFIGKVSIPDTPKGREQELILGVSPVINSKKELMKKYEEKAGVFGGNRQIIYSYKITVENNSKDKKEVTVLDNFPVSTSDEINVEIRDLSHKYKSDTKTLKSAKFARGIRTFIVEIPGHSKKEIEYKAAITFDKKLKIGGLK